MTFQRELAWQQLDLKYRSSVAHQAARYALALDYSLLPPEVVHRAKCCVIDALGCAIGAYHAPGRTVCEETAKEIGGPEEATIFCSGLRTGVLNAALVNSFLVRFLDYSDQGGGGHNSDALASILAVAEREKAKGVDFLTSLVISYELGARFEESLTNSVKGAFANRVKGWTMDIRAGFNQPPALGKMMRMTEEQIANAIGTCMSHTLPMGILDCDEEENFMAKNLRFGWAAHDAVLACLLAKRGFTGPVRVLELSVGIKAVISNGEMDLDRLTDFSGWRMLDVRFKALPSNGGSHAHLFSTLGIINEQKLKPEDIAQIQITIPEKERRHTTCPPKKYPRNAESADHSSFYVTAYAAKRGEFTTDAYKPESFTDPVILELIEKTTVKADPNMKWHQGASEIVTKDGRRFQKRIEDPHGVGEHDPLSDKELEDKFSQMAAEHMSEKQIRKLLDTCWNLDKVADIGTLTAQMVFRS